MPRRFPPAQMLHAFDEAARHMSFTEAARALGITQAAVSQRIRMLEHQLGEELFVRLPRGLELTEAGRAFVPASHEAFDRLAAGIAEAFGSLGEGPVTLRTTPGFASHWLARRLPAFQRAHPQIRLRVTSAIWPSDFDLSSVDMEVRYGRGAWEGVEIEQLVQEQVTPVCCPAFAERLSQPADLARETLLHTAGFEVGWSQWLAEAGVPGLGDTAPALSCDTQTTVLAFAAEGCGVALGRTRLIDTSVWEGWLVTPFAQRIDTGESFFAVRVAGREPRAEAEAFWQWLRAVAVEPVE
jgi:LysR family transcriptional regulator, glycine cleavage system transcriptional activator